MGVIAVSKVRSQRISGGPTRPMLRLLPPVESRTETARKGLQKLSFRRSLGPILIGGTLAILFMLMPNRRPLPPVPVTPPPAAASVVAPPTTLPPAPRVNRTRWALMGHSGEISDLAFTRDGRLMVSLGSNDQTLRIWDRKGGPIQTFSLGSDLVDGEIAVAPSGRFVSLTTSSGIRILDRTARVLTASCDFADAGVSYWSGSWVETRARCAFRREDEMAIVAGFRHVTWVDPASGNHVRRLTLPADCVRPVGISKDGDMCVYLRQDGAVWLVDTRTGELRTQYRLESVGVPPVLRGYFSADGNRLIVACPAWAAVYEVFSGKRLCLIRPAGRLGAVDLSATGDRVFATGYGGFLRAWDVETGRPVSGYPDGSGDALGAGYSHCLSTDPFTNAVAVGTTEGWIVCPNP
jgi:WD40 repeat protein